MKFDLNLPARRHAVVVTDQQVGALYADSLLAELGKSVEKVDLLTISGGEHCKNQQTKADLERQLFDLGAQRDTLIVALGGGVVGDLAGFVAATYMRGIDYIQVPTTLLAMVDSSIGGKTGVNTDYGKNLIGAIWHPIDIVRQPRVLASLPQDQMVNGLVEVAKIFLTCDAQALKRLTADLNQILAGDIGVLEPHIYRAIELKEEVVGRDEREKGERAILNFGHTIGHAFELLSDYDMLHGFAVGKGIWVESCMARLEGCLDDKEFVVVTDLLAGMGIGSEDCQKWEADQVWSAMKHDKKAGGDRINYVALSGLGQVHQQGDAWIKPMDKQVFAAALSEFLESANRR